MTHPSSQHPDAGIIRVRFHDLKQLFNPLDPSPIANRDLDANAEEFILSWAREIPVTTELKLVIHLASPPLAEQTTNAQQAIRRYFEDRASHKQRQFRQLMRRGRLSLVVGLTFLTLCLTISNVLEKLGVSTLSSILQESFIIVGWVAMWRPLEIYLYDWWPLRAEWRVLKRLSDIQIKLEHPAS